MSGNHHPCCVPVRSRSVAVLMTRASCSATFSHFIRRTNSLPFTSNDNLSFSSANTLSIEEARRSGSSGRTRIADSPNISRRAGMSEMTQARPADIASATARPKPSLRDGKTKILDSRRYCWTWWSSTYPVRRTLFSSFSELMRKSSSAWFPLDFVFPTITRFAPGVCLTTCFHARSSWSIPLPFSGLPTKIASNFLAETTFVSKESTPLPVTTTCLAFRTPRAYSAVNSDGQKQAEALLTAIRLIRLTLVWAMEKGKGEPCMLALRSDMKRNLSSLRFESSCRTTNRGFLAIKLTMKDGTIQFALSA